MAAASTAAPSTLAYTESAAYERESVEEFNTKYNEDQDQEDQHSSFQSVPQDPGYFQCVKCYKEKVQEANKRCEMW